MADEPQPSPLAPLGREEYVEQSHFFRALAERLEVNVPAQEVLASVREEVLATTKLPLAIDFLLGELRHEGVLGPAMSAAAALLHAVSGLRHRRVGKRTPAIRLARRPRNTPSRGQVSSRVSPRARESFSTSSKSLCRHRLGYDRGLEAIAGDPAFEATWRDWILKLRRQIGMVDMADVIYVHSEYYWQRRREIGAGDPAAGSRRAAPERADLSVSPEGAVILFGEREGRIALANRKKDPLFLFSSLHRQLGYPEVPRMKPADQETGASCRS